MIALNRNHLLSRRFTFSIGMSFLSFIVCICLLNRSAQGFGAPQWRPRVRASLSSSIKMLTKHEGGTKTGMITHRTRWGVDKGHDDEEYWFNSKIHSLGNTGFMGAIHAAMAPVATTVIDNLAYNGVNVRKLIATELATIIDNGKPRVVDLCCGVGLSTRALQNAFPEAEMLIGVDTSPEMISMANFLSHPQRIAYNVTEFLSTNTAACSKLLDKRGMTMKRAFVKAKRAFAKFSCANAEATSLPDKAFDLVTVMYAFHETPPSGRTKILAEAHRLLHKGGILALLDITPEYQPSKSMLAGEPYVLEYQQNINRQLQACKGFTRATFRSIVPGHLGLWLLKRI